MKHNSFTLVILTAAVLVGGCAKQPDAPRSVANAEQPKPQAQTPGESKPVDAAATVAPINCSFIEVSAAIARMNPS